MRRSRFFNTLLQSDFEALAVLRAQAVIARPHATRWPRRTQSRTRASN